MTKNIKEYQIGDYVYVTDEQWRHRYCYIAKVIDVIIVDRVLRLEFKDGRILLFSTRLLRQATEDELK